MAFRLQSLRCSRIVSYSIFKVSHKSLTIAAYLPDYIHCGGFISSIFKMTTFCMNISFAVRFRGYYIE